MKHEVDLDIIKYYNRKTGHKIKYFEAYTEDRGDPWDGSRVWGSQINGKRGRGLRRFRAEAMRWR